MAYRTVLHHEHAEAPRDEGIVDDIIALVRVRDSGCGMTREILEDQLLVLFRSTKEKDASKIGISSKCRARRPTVR